MIPQPTKPNDDGDVTAVPRPLVNGIYHAICNESVNAANDFNEIKIEIKCEEEEADNKKDSDNSEVIKKEIEKVRMVMEEPDDNVDISSRPTDDGKFPTIYDKPFDVAHDFNELMDENRCEEEEEMVKEKEPVPFKRSEKRATIVSRSSDSDDALYPLDDDSTEAAQEELNVNKETKIDDQYKRCLKQRQQCSSSSNPSSNCVTSNKKEDDKKKQFGSTDDSLYSLHDFDIDIDLDVIMSTKSTPHPSQKPIIPATFRSQKPIIPTTDAAPKRTIKLEDYKKRRGLI